MNADSMYISICTFDVQVGIKVYKLQQRKEITRIHIILSCSKGAILSFSFNCYFWSRSPSRYSDSDTENSSESREQRLSDAGGQGGNWQGALSAGPMLFQATLLLHRRQLNSVKINGSFLPSCEYCMKFHPWQISPVGLLLCCLTQPLGSAHCTARWSDILHCGR